MTQRERVLLILFVTLVLGGGGIFGAVYYFRVSDGYSKRIIAARSDIQAKETEIAREQTMNDPKNKSKPANILEKILEGKLKTWFAENVLAEQPFVKDDSKTISQLLAGQGLKLVKFVRFKVGEKS